MLSSHVQIWYNVEKDTDAEKNLRIPSVAFWMDSVNAGKTTAWHFWQAVMFLLPALVMPYAQVMEICNRQNIVVPVPDLESNRRDSSAGLEVSYASTVPGANRDSAQAAKAI